MEHEETAEAPERVYATVEQLRTVRLQEDDVEVPGVGWVRVRAMSRWETTHIQGLGDNRQKQDAEAIRIATVRPLLTADDVSAWRKAGRVMELETIARKINELSGIGKDAAKSDVHADGDGPDV